MESYRQFWFLFQLIIRFMALHTHEKNLQATPRVDRFAEWMSEDISIILQMYFALSQNAVTELAVIGGFVKDLLGVYDRGAVLCMVPPTIILEFEFVLLSRPYFCCLHHCLSFYSFHLDILKEVDS